MKSKAQTFLNISGVMPVRNGLEFLPRSRMIIEQTLAPGDELIVVDDGSTDASYTFLKRWENENSQVRLIKNDSQGLINALNLGVKESQNSWIARFDVDDIYPSERLSKQRASIAESTGAIFSDYEIIDSKNRPLGVLPSPVESHATSVSLVNGNRTPHPSVLFSKAVYLSVGGYRTQDFLVEDLSLWLRMSRESKLVSIPEVLLQYKIHGKSVSVSKSIEMQENKKELLKNIGIFKQDITYCLNNLTNTLSLYEDTKYASKRNMTHIYDLFTLFKLGLLSRHSVQINTRVILSEFSKLENYKAVLSLGKEKSMRDKTRNL
jgi:glycosyltransferase involved in cell wall biosynthesis